MHAARSAHARFRRTLAVAAVCLAALLAVLVFPGSASAAPAVGDIDTFWTLDWGANSYVQKQASVRWAGEHAVIYVAKDALLADTLVASLGVAFDSNIYPTLTAAYGAEPNPGIDGDSRVVILIYDFHDNPIGSIQGAFFARDLAPDGDGHSNLREMFHLNLQAVISEPQNAGALAAHEFAHLILYYRDAMLDPSHGAPESSWLSEGFTTYAEHLCGYNQRVDSLLRSFALQPSTNLTQWLGMRENYGASYAFMRYLAQRQGTDFIRALVEQPLDGAAGVNAVLQSQGAFTSFNQLFDDWVVACFVDGTPSQVWPYFFDELTVSTTPVTLVGTEPILGEAQGPNYGAAYLDFPPSSPAEIFRAVIDGVDESPLQAALISWDSSGGLFPVVQRFTLSSGIAGGTVTASAGYDRHTLAVWARGSVGTGGSFEFVYSGASDPAGGIVFLDTSGSDPYYPDVATLLERGVISGKEIPAGSGLYFFAGRDELWRAQFAKMIMESTGLHTAEIDNLGRPSFTDVPLVREGGGYKAYPYDYVEEAVALGVVKGYPNGTFLPYSPVTRGQLVAMIVRGAVAAGKPMPMYEGSAKVFADVPVSHTFYREIMTAYYAGIFQGSSQNGKLYFDPYSKAVRNHVARMTANFVRYLEAYAAPGS